MGEVMKQGLALAVVLMAALASGCGSAGETTRTDPLAKYPKGPTREFIVPGGDNAIQVYGHEASRRERAQASGVIAAWMKARADRNWQEDCSYFSRAYVHNLVAKDATRVTHGRVKNCPQALAYFGPQASGDYVDNLDGPIDSLRAGEGHGYAQYHGNDGKDWILPVDREGGRWLVANATPIERTQ